VAFDDLTESTMDFRTVWDRWRERAALPFDIYGNSVDRWLASLAVLVAVLLVLRLVKALLHRRATAVAARFPGDWTNGIADLIHATKGWFLLIAAMYTASLVLELPAKAVQVLQSIAIVVLLLQVAVWGNVVLALAISSYMKRRLAADAVSVTTIATLGFVAKLLLWAVVILLALENVGVDVTALIAGLGIGGIAVALAAQNILGDLFASLSIVLDKPFVVGETIVVDEHTGTVEYIGLKTTRLRSLSGEQLIFANSDLLKSRIRNFKRMQERRLLFTIGVTYQTPREKVAAIPQMIREAIEAQQPVRFDRAHFKEFGPSGLIFEVVYFVLAADFLTYANVQQAINLALLERFAREEIEFAYPTQFLYVQRAM
jgi:small-conductance mechanosensitive channel